MMASGSHADQALPENASNSQKKGRTGPPDSTTPKSSTSQPNMSLSRHRNRNAQMYDPGASDCKYFFEDQVFYFNKKGVLRFGTVIETSDSYDEDDEDVITKGEVRVAWYPDGKEELLPDNKIGLADRTLMPGDVVRRLVPGKDTQRGYCREIKMRADVKIVGTKFVICNVPTDRLRTIMPLQRGSAVCMESWVGSTKEVTERATLRSSHGSRIEIPSKLYWAFEDLRTHQTGGVYEPIIIFPGNIVVGRLQNLVNVKLLTPDIPLRLNRKGKPAVDKFFVEKVVVESAWVQWQCKAWSEDNGKSSSMAQPDQCVKGDDVNMLKNLNLFDACMVQICDRNFLTFSENDIIMNRSDWDEEQTAKYKTLLEELLAKEEVKNLTLLPATTSTMSQTFNKIKKKFGFDSDKLDKKKTITKQDKSTSIDLKDVKTDPTESKDSKDDKGKNKRDNKKSKAKDKSKDENTEKSKEKSSSKDVRLDISRSSNSSGWVSEEDDFPIDEIELNSQNMDLLNDEPSTATSSAQGSVRYIEKRRNIKKKAGKGAKKKCDSKVDSIFMPAELRENEAFSAKDGDEIVTEALLIRSEATVVWQDGSIEHNIQSTDLYPIHHLDNHEFFPGDFVVSAKENTCFRDYGVIQTVDHQGRTAVVKWFTTYTSSDEPRPTFNYESEVSVYDIKDHPDFQYRPGTMVIRVANFVGDDMKSTAGQIVDNYTDGRVKVWWVDGHVSKCWPQDLFEVAQQDHGEWQDSDDSWETESENCEYGGDVSFKRSHEQSKILSNMERARSAIVRLESLFKKHPSLQTTDVQDSLLSVYKGCCFLDNLLETDFFDEKHFKGLVKRTDTQEDRQDSQIISEKNVRSETLKLNEEASTSLPPVQTCQYQAILGMNTGSNSNSTGKEYAPKVLVNLSSTPCKCKKSNPSESDTEISESIDTSLININLSPLTQSRRKLSVGALANETLGGLYNLLKIQTVPNTNAPGEILEIESDKESQRSLTEKKDSEKNILLSTAITNIEKAYEKTTILKSSFRGVRSQDDSGHYSRNENCDGSTNSCASCDELTNADQSVVSPKTSDGIKPKTNDEIKPKTNDDIKPKTNDDIKPKTNDDIKPKTNDDIKPKTDFNVWLVPDATPESLCIRFCRLLKHQIGDCITEFREKCPFEEDVNLSDALGYEGLKRETSETIIEIRETGDDNGEVDSDDDIDIVVDLEGNNDDVDMSEDKSLNGVEVSGIQSEKLTDGNSEDIPNTDVVQEPEEVDQNEESMEYFQVISSTPESHKFYSNNFVPNNPQQYHKAIHREYKMLRTALPPGVWVRAFEDRLDLLSVMMEGPRNTPYEDGLFLFDFQMGREYPKNPPQCHYISYCSDRLNPNLYEDGKVCVSLLGTWSGRDTEVWGPKSTLLQVIVSIQGLILVPEPYYNEAGFEKQKGTQQGYENSRMYNEMALIKLVQATSKMMSRPPALFKKEIYDHLNTRGMIMYDRIINWMRLSMDDADFENLQGKASIHKYNKKAISKHKLNETEFIAPEFPLVPASRGFCLTIAGLLEVLKSKLLKLALNTLSEDEETEKNVAKNSLKRTAGTDMDGEEESMGISCKFSKLSVTEEDGATIINKQTEENSTQTAVETTVEENKDVEKKAENLQSVPTTATIESNTTEVPQIAQSQAYQNMKMSDAIETVTSSSATEAAATSRTDENIDSFQSVETSDSETNIIATTSVNSFKSAVSFDKKN